MESLQTIIVGRTAHEDRQVGAKAGSQYGLVVVACNKQLKQSIIILFGSLLLFPVHRCTSHDRSKLVKRLGNQTFRVVFVCAHSRQPGHDLFENQDATSLTNAPWMKTCL